MEPNSPGLEAAEARYWHDAVSLPTFRALIAAKKRLLVPMVLAYFAFFTTITLLAGYAKPLMTTRVLGSFNVAYLLVVIMYVLCWIMAVRYVKVANRDFDAMAADAIAELATKKATHEVPA